MKRILSIILIVLCANSVFGQSVQFINISSDPYSNSMGGVTLTLDATPFTVQSNASAMPFAKENLYIGASYSTINKFLVGASGFGKIGNLAVGLNAKYYNHLPYNITSEQGYISGEFQPIELAAEVGVAYKILGGLSVGGNLRYIISNLGPEHKGNSFCGDISATYKLGHLSVAAAGVNIGSKIDYSSSAVKLDPKNLPAMGKLGVGYTLHLPKKQKLNFALEGDYLIYQSAFMAGAGVEYDFKDMVSIRGGYHYGDNSAIPSYVSAGVGFKLKGVRIDASYQTNGIICAALGVEF